MNPPKRWIDDPQFIAATGIDLADEQLDPVDLDALKARVMENCPARASAVIAASIVTWLLSSGIQTNARNGKVITANPRLKKNTWRSTGSVVPIQRPMTTISA